MSRREFKVDVTGLTRDERREILDIIDVSLSERGLWVYASGNYSLDGETSYNTYKEIDESKIHRDMSVQACAERFNCRRAKILAMIRDGDVSSSMSGIEYYVDDFHRLGIRGDWMAIETCLTWNGTRRTSRIDWKREYEEWLTQIGPIQ